jgi:glycosyltransferase involved in cell wall biosynthesis
MSSLAAANKAFRNHEYERAIELYEISKKKSPELAYLAEKNIMFIERRKKSRARLFTEDLSGLGVLGEGTRGSVFGYKIAHIARHVSGDFPSAALRASETKLIKVKEILSPRKWKPLVSVIMPTYNRGEIIVSAIKSVLDQDYENWELFVCDDASTDNTETLVSQINDPRITYLKLPKKGAAASRNAGLKQAQGSVIAYLDSDNYWHPFYLSRMLIELLDHPGHSSVYSDFIDYQVKLDGSIRLSSYECPPFNQEKLLKKNFIDLNTFIHRRELYDLFGGFEEKLTRRQDYDLIIKYTWLRDPLHVQNILALYQRNETLGQITLTQKNDNSCLPIIEGKINNYLSQGLPLRGQRPVKKVTILSWDLSRNHFSKPFALAEALARDYQVQLISFQFFEEPIFPPLEGVNPPFETVYLPGGKFPDFFDSIDRALKKINGDVIYVVKPRLPSLGLALLANQLLGVPIILEINDLETVVSSPKAGDQHTEVSLDQLDLADPALLSPFSDLWSHLMDPLAKAVPTLVTHNKNIDTHFGNRCLYMRNLKDETVYDPARYDRNAVRADLGFNSEDRVILFGGLLRKHKGIYELVELVDRLGDPRYKLLFVGSRPTPDQEKLVKHYGERVRVLPPQNREAMARINLAADLVILWLDPDVPASRYQMPYKATDAFAMGPSIIANDISDLGPLGAQGYLHTVPFGDWERMTKVVRKIFDQPEETAKMRNAARRLYMRQFSYAAARSNFELAVKRALAAGVGRMPVAEEFAKRFNGFHKTLTGSKEDFIDVAEPTDAIAATLKILGHGAAEEDTSIVALDVQSIASISFRDPKGVAIVMPSIDTAKALDTARLLVRRAGMQVKLFIVEDTLRQGFIRTLNDTAARLDVKYIVYLAEDAFPGVDWLKLAYTKLEETGKGLLAFNCGKWRGRIAAFGMVRIEWVSQLYGGPLLYPGYMSHKADNEITVIARVTDQAIYDGDCVLVEIDAKKVFKENAPEDKALFHDRFRTGFDGLAPIDKLRPLAKLYFVPLETAKTPKKKPKKGEETKSSDQKTPGSETFREQTSFFRCPLSFDEHAELRNEYIKKKLNDEPDAFVLYRVIGNDLYPRHRTGQSRENLQFILSKEPKLADCEKRFIVNRIIDPAEESAIVRLLNQSNARYIVIPFDAEEYRQIGFDFSRFEESGFLSKAHLEKFDEVKQGRLQLALYRLKNNYVMNNNGARNMALREGRERAKWILPFDGNCFITEVAWNSIRRDITTSPHLKYFVVPMTRVTYNQLLLEPSFKPDTSDEPQIVFRKDALEDFDEAYCYGRRPKVELFWRLGVAGKWDAYKDDSWDLVRNPSAPEARQFGVAGWVARLFSGMGQLETQDTIGADNRYLARAEAILTTLRKLDASLAGAEAQKLASVCEHTISNQNKTTVNVVKQMAKAADKALHRGPYSVIDKTSRAPSGDPQDYWHPAPYWWPDPKKPDGLPYVRRDGERVPGTRMYEPDSEKYDRTRLQCVFDDTLVLALAGHMTGNRAYSCHASAIIRRFFLDPETRMNPHLKYGQVRIGHNKNQGASTGLIETKDLYFYVDAARLLQHDKVLTEVDIEGFKVWLAQYLKWLLISPQGTAERRAVNNHGTCYDLQVGAIAAFLGDTKILYETLARATSRIEEQFDARGSQIDELKRTNTAHYCCFNFQSWINLARLAGRWGVDLWAYEGPRGHSLKQGALWLLSHMGKPWPYQQIDTFDEERFLPIWFAAYDAGVDGLPDLPTGISSPLDVKPVFFPHDGIRPYWSLDVIKL